MATRSSSQRGAILIQVALASIALIAFTMFVVDYGIMWVSRSQAQNSADAGAMAGAVALAFDDFADRSDTGPAKLAAQNFAFRNDVFGEDPDVDIATDVIFYQDDPAKFPDECADHTCIRVDVYRNQDRQNPLPMWVGQLVGLTQQGVRATAIAKASFGNATDCLKPWAVVDRWEENWEDGEASTAPWTDDSEFDKYMQSGPDIVPDPSITDPDVYVPPTATYDDDGNIEWDSYSPGSGFHPYNPDRTYTADYGKTMWLKAGDKNDFKFGSGWFMALALEDSKGGKDYKNNIKGCVGTTYQIGDELEILNEPGEKVGPTRQAVEQDGDPNDLSNPDNSLVNQDPGAYWDQTLNEGRGGVNGSAFAVSPRIVAIPLVDPDRLFDAPKQDGRKMVAISNIAGFFVEGYEDKGVKGRLMTMPGLKSTGNGGNPANAFLVNVSLIR